MRSHRPGPGSRSLSPPPISTKPRPGADTAAVASSSLSPPRIRGGGGGSSHASGGGGHYPIYPPVTALRTSEQPPPPRHQRPTAARRACLLAEHTHAHSSSGGSSSRRVGLSSSSSLSFPAPPEHYHTAATPLDRPPSNRAPRSRSPPPLPPPLPSSSSPPPAHRRQAAAAAHSGYYPIYPPVPLRSSSLAFAERECHRRPPPPLAPEDLSPARAAADEEGQPYSAAPHFLFPSGGQSRRAGAAEAGAGIGGYAAQHTHKQHHHGSVARAVGGAGELSGELRGYAEYLSPGGMGGRQEGSWRLGSDVQRKGGALLRPSRYSAYQERRPFY